MALADEGAVPAQRQDGRSGDIVHWLVLIISGVLEAVWATALATSDRLRRHRVQFARTNGEWTTRREGIDCCRSEAPAFGFARAA